MNKVNCESIFSFSDRLKHLETFNSDNGIWVVSDLVLKKRIKSFLLETSPCFHSGSVMRAQEFWQFLFTRLYPDFSIKSNSFVKGILKNFLLTNNLEGSENNSYIQNLFSCISSFLPLFISPSTVDHFLEWLKKNPDPYLEAWFSLSFKAWRHLLKTKVVSASFITGVLSSDSVDLFSFLKEKKIIFDLGFQLQAIEVDCIKTISKVTDVKVLRPEFTDSKISDTCLWTYKLLKNVSLYQNHFALASNPKKPSLKKSSEAIKTISFEKYSNQLAEIRSAIKKIKYFLKSGVHLNNIAIVAPDIEYFWPALSLQLKKENLSVSKSVVSSCHSSKMLMLWLARLRVAMGRTSYSDLEMAFALEKNSSLSYADLKYHFSNIYSSDSYQKTSWSQQLLDKSLGSNAEVKLLDFLDWAFSFWKVDNFNNNLSKEEANKIWQKVYQSLRQGGVDTLKLSLKSWLFYAEDLLSKETITLSKEVFNSISCYNLANSDNLEEQYIILLDLSFESLKNKTVSSISFSQALSLSEDLGVSVNQGWGSSLEGVLKYIVQLKDKHIFCSWSAINLESKRQVASAFFLEEYFKYHQKKLEFTNLYPELSNEGDKEQIIYKKQLRSKEFSEKNLCSPRILYDKNLLSMQKVPPKLDSISVTNIQRYLDCPFIFFSEKILKLQDLPDWDLDIDVMKKGSIFHKLLELIVTKGIVESGDTDLLFSELNEYRKKELKIEESRWVFLKTQLQVIAKDFIALEKNQALESPHLKVDCVEHSLKAFWSRSKKDFLINGSYDLEEKRDEGLLVKGKVDRMDSDKEMVLIRDYKTNIKSRAAVGAWQKKKDWSLFLYYKLWKSYGHEKDFLAAFYVDVKEFKSKGLWLEGKRDYKFIGLSKNSKIEEAEKKDIFSALDKDLGQLLEDVLSGNFLPHPKDKKTCGKCKWSGLCRISEHF